MVVVMVRLLKFNLRDKQIPLLVRDDGWVGGFGIIEIIYQFNAAYIASTVLASKSESKR